MKKRTGSIIIYRILHFSSQLLSSQYILGKNFKLQRRHYVDAKEGVVAQPVGAGRSYFDEIQIPHLSGENRRSPFEGARGFGSRNDSGCKLTRCNLIQMIENSLQDPWGTV